MLAGLLAVAAVLWTFLPRWAPVWVERRSPWLEPVLRAAAVRSETTHELGDDIIWPRLSHWPDPITPTLIRALDHPDLRVRVIAARCLASFPDAAALAPLLRNIGEPDLELREAAAYAVSQIAQEADTAQVMAALPHADVAAAALLIGWLAEKGDWSGLRLVVERMDPVGALRLDPVPVPRRYRHSTSDFDQAVWAMVERLHDSGQGERAAAGIVPLLTHAQADWRCVGIELLRALGAARQVPRVAERLVDADAQVRTAAGDALLELAAETPGCLAAAVPLLVRQLAPQPGPERLQVARVLAAAAGIRAQNALAACVRSRDWDAPTRLKALEGLARPTAPEVLALLIDVLADGAGDGLPARQLAARGLGGARTASAERALLEACTDAVAEVRLEAVAGLVEADDPNVDAAMIARLRDSDEAVRDTAVESIAARRHPPGIAALVALVAGAERDVALAEEPAAVIPLWMSAYDELTAVDMPLDTAQRAVLAAMAGRRDADRRTIPAPTAPAGAPAPADEHAAP